MKNQLREGAELIEQVLNETIEWNFKDLDLSEFGDASDFYEHLDYSNALHEQIASCIDICNRDLRAWAVDNYEYCEQATEEGLVNTKEFDYHKFIEAGQFVYYSELMREAVAEKFEEYESNN